MHCTAGLPNLISIVLSRATAPQLRWRRYRQTGHSASKAERVHFKARDNVFSASDDTIRKLHSITGLSTSCAHCYRSRAARWPALTVARSSCLHEGPRRTRPIALRQRHAGPVCKAATQFRKRCQPHCQNYITADYPGKDTPPWRVRLHDDTSRSLRQLAFNVRTSRCSVRSSASSYYPGQRSWISPNPCGQGWRRCDQRRELAIPPCFKWIGMAAPPRASH